MCFSASKAGISQNCLAEVEYLLSSPVQWEAPLYFRVYLMYSWKQYLKSAVGASSGVAQ